MNTKIGDANKYLHPFDLSLCNNVTKLVQRTMREYNTLKRYYCNDKSKTCIEIYLDMMAKEWHIYLHVSLILFANFIYIN